MILPALVETAKHVVKDGREGPEVGEPAKLSNVVRAVSLRQLGVVALHVCQIK